MRRCRCAFVTDRRIAALNREHLGHAGPTDVISFALAPVGKKAEVVGDVYISPAWRGRTRARTVEACAEELLRLVVHGVLHVVGHDHPRRRLALSVAHVEAAGTPAHPGPGVGVTLSWLVSLLALALGAACALADGALLTAGRENQSREGSTLPHGDARERTHRALSIARLFSQLTAAASFAIAAELWMRPLAVSIAIAVAGGVIILVAGEILPREIGDIIGTPVLVRLAMFISVLDLILNPLVIIGIAIDGMLARLLPTRPLSAERESQASPLRDVVAHGPQTPREQRAILRRVFSLGNTEVQEVMVPRVDIIGVERATPWSEVVEALGHRAPPSRREGFEELLREGGSEGIGEREEIEIITGVVQFGERVLHDVMTPRTAVFAVDISLSPLEMAAVIASGYSRVPVYRDSLIRSWASCTCSMSFATAANAWRRSAPCRTRRRRSA